MGDTRIEAKISRDLLQPQWRATAGSIYKCLEYCLEHHQNDRGYRGRGDSGCSQRVLEGLFLDVPDIILVDVQRLCLVRANTSHKYLALSYVWGGVKQVRTTKSTVDELQNPYSLEKIWEKLPQV